MNYPEIKEALLKVMEARADINSCVNFNEDDIDNADILYYQCKHYCEDYKNRTTRNGGLK